MKYLAVAFTLAVFSGAANAQNALTLDQAITTAIQNHPLMRAADLDTQAAQAGVDISRANYFPQLNGDAARVFADPGTRIAATNGLNDPTILDRGSFGVSLSQLITDFGRTSALVSASTSELNEQRANQDLTESFLTLAVTQAFFDVLRAEALVRVAHTTQQARQTLLDRVTGLFDAKLRSNLDLSIARQGLAEADLLMLRANTKVDDAYAALARALGMGDTSRPMLSEPADVPPPPTARDALLSVALDHNPALRALDAGVRAAQQRADAEERAQYPTISAMGAAGVTPERDPTSGLKPHYAAGGVVLDVPLFTGGRLSARERQASLKADALKQRYLDQRNVVTRDVNIAFGEAQTAFRNIDVTEQVRRNAGTTLDLTQNLYEIGKGSIVDLNQAQVAATQAEIAHTDAIFDYRLQRALLDYLTGVVRGAS